MKLLENGGLQWNLTNIAIALAKVTSIFSSRRNTDVIYLGMLSLKRLVRNLSLRIAMKYKMVVRALEFGPDHVHLFLGNCKKYSVPQVAQYFKGASSRELRKKYMDRVKIKLWGDSFWSDGYFYESVGRVTSESVEYYITASAC